MRELLSYPLTTWIALSLACAAGAPWLARAAGRWSVIAFALVPLLQFGYFCSRIPEIPDAAPGVLASESFAWLSEPQLEFALRLDGLSLLFALMISGVGSLIVIYASRYLAEHPQLGRFYAALFLFMAAMLGIVLSDNLIATFVFWELTSISSYFLIGFDHEREEARAAALQALLVTGLGGLAMLAGFLLLATAGQSFQISELLARGEAIRSHALYVPILLLIVAGAFTKSAQFPFHFWLPDAMQAPTPVSAYLHSATMVKAGIFLLARLTPALGGTELWAALLAAAGAATMLTGVCLSLVQSDLKLILAYMTVTALGLLTLLLGIGSEEALVTLMAYVLIHSLYKGGLFLIAGNVDHGAGTRDVRRLSALAVRMRLTAASAALSALSMAGVPLLFGFIGKELIFETLWSDVRSAPDGSTLPPSLLGATVLTMAAVVSISALLGYKIFFSPRPPGSPNKAHEAPVPMVIGPLLLSLIGLGLGLAPGLAEGLVQGAASAALGTKTQAHLKIWHGFNLPLLLSVVSVGLGLVLYLARERAARILTRVLQLVRTAQPSRLYSGLLSALMETATRLTPALQSGGVRRYLFYVFVSITLVTAYGLARLGDAALSFEWAGIRYYEWVLCALIVLGALTAAVAASPLIAVTALGVTGYAIALIYVIFGAPDLAMTQFLVETLTVILLALVLSKLPGYPKRERSPGRSATELAIASMFGLLMTALTWRVIQKPLDWSLSEYFASKSLSEAHGRNIVNVILVDFRALDTLGEISVLGLAGLGVYGLVRLRPRTGKKGAKEA